MILRLVIIGENIFEICLGQCLFEFGFPFGQVPASKWQIHQRCFSLQSELAVVKRIPLGEKGEKVVVEHTVTVSGEEVFFVKISLFDKYLSQIFLYLTTAQTSTLPHSSAAVTS